MASTRYNLRVEDVIKAWNMFLKEQGNKGFFTLLKTSETASFSASMKTCKAEVWFVHGKLKKQILTTCVRAVVKTPDTEEVMWQDVGIQLIKELCSLAIHPNFELVINGTYNGEELWKQK